MKMSGVIGMPPNEPKRGGHEMVGDDLLSDKLDEKPRLTVICGANTEHLENMRCMLVSQVREKMQEVLNVGEDHTIVLLNGKPVAEDVVLKGDEELEFRKPAGQKG